MEEKKKKKILPIVVLICIAIVIVAMGSYALWQMTAKQSGRNVVGTTCLSIDIENESEGITIANGWPMSDADGANTDPYTFTIRNKCDQAVNYIVALESLPAGENEPDDYLDYDYIRVKLDRGMANTYGALENATNDNGVRDTKEITHHTLAANGSVTHNLRIWVKEDTPLQNEDESYNTEKYFYGKVKILAGQGIAGDAPVTIGVVGEGNINTVGTEVQIGDEHFYVIGDDENVSGNVKLLAKYNLLVGDNETTDLFADGEESCESSGGEWDDRTEICYYSSHYTNATPGYNRQSADALGVYTAIIKITAYVLDENSESLCTNYNGVFEYDDEDDAYYCLFITLDTNDTSNDNITELGEANIDSVPAPIDQYSSTVWFVPRDNYYWLDGDNNLKSEYTIQSNQSFPYVYYDHNKNLDSNNLIAPYVNAYVDILEEDYRIGVGDARLMSLEEAIALGCESSESDYPYDCSSAPSWLADRNFWLGTTTYGSYKDNYYIYTINKKYDDGEYDYYIDYSRSCIKDGESSVVSKYGVRPVISVSKSLFN